MSLPKAFVRPKGRVPYYDIYGHIQDWIAPERALQMEATGTARVVRSKKRVVTRVDGKKQTTWVPRIVRCIRLRRKAEPKPPTTDDYKGQKYSFREPLRKVKPGAGAWKFKQLGRGGELAPIFLRVVTDCLVQEGAARCS